MEAANRRRESAAGKCAPGNAAPRAGSSQERQALNAPPQPPARLPSSNQERYRAKNRQPRTSPRARICGCVREEEGRGRWRLVHVSGNERGNQNRDEENQVNEPEGRTASERSRQNQREMLAFRQGLEPRVAPAERYTVFAARWNWRCMASVWWQEKMLARYGTDARTQRPVQ